MAFEVKNKLRQPLVVNAPNGAVHFLAKEVKPLTEEQFNAPELKRHMELGNVVVLRME